MGVSEHWYLAENKNTFNFVKRELYCTVAKSI